MKILLTGASGQVGWELARQLAPLGPIVAPTRTELDLAQPLQVSKTVESIAPDLIVNAAAYTAVDRAESDARACLAVNAESVGLLAQYARRARILLVHYSTDYVFDGTHRAPYVETDATAPINTYGRSKLAGEVAVLQSGCRYLIMRTGWVYARRGNNFLLTMLRLARERPRLRVVDDQVGAPTWAHDIAAATRAALQRPEPLEGLYHAAAQGATSWCGFARRILELQRLATPVEPIGTAEYPTAAVRPAYSVLNSSRFADASGFRIGDWDERLAVCLRDSA